MKSASINEIKQELMARPPKEVLDLCLRLTRYKKENKELLTYLLFEAHDPQSYIESAKQEIEENFIDVPVNNTYLGKKSLRKILKSIGKYSKHTATKQAEAELLIYFCHCMQKKGLPMHRSVALTNLYNQQIKKILVVVNALHDDLKFDYLKQLDQLE